MGQYYIVANIDKKEYMRSNGGVKLMEWSYNRNPLVLNLMKKLANEWKNDRVFVAGDYALSKDRIDKDKNPIEKDYDYEILEKIEKELNIYDKEDKGYDITLYGFANDNFKEIKLEKLENEEYRYIYNHNKKEFIDLEHCPLAWLYKEKGNYKQVKISYIFIIFHYLTSSFYYLIYLLFLHKKSVLLMLPFLSLCCFYISFYVPNLPKNPLP